MGMRPAARMPKLTRRSRMLITIALAVILLLLVGPRLIDGYVDWLWFGELGYRAVFTTVLFTRLVLFLVAGLLVGGIVLGCGAAWVRSESAHWRVAVGAAGAGLSALVFLLAEPRCLAGPYAMMDPTAKALWLDHIPEMEPFLTVARQSPVFGAWMATFPLLALLSSLLLARDRGLRSDFGFLVNAAALLVAVVGGG